MKNMNWHLEPQQLSQQVGPKQKYNRKFESLAYRGKLQLAGVAERAYWKLLRTKAWDITVRDNEEKDIDGDWICVKVNKSGYVMGMPKAPKVGEPRIIWYCPVSGKWSDEKSEELKKSFETWLLQRENTDKWMSQKEYDKAHPDAYEKDMTDDPWTQWKKTQMLALKEKRIKRSNEKGQHLKQKPPIIAAMQQRKERLLVGDKVKFEKKVTESMIKSESRVKDDQKYQDKLLARVEQEYEVSVNTELNAKQSQSSILSQLAIATGADFYNEDWFQNHVDFFNLASIVTQVSDFKYQDAYQAKTTAGRTRDLFYKVPRDLLSNDDFSEDLFKKDYKVDSPLKISTVIDKEFTELPYVNKDLWKKMVTQNPSHPLSIYIETTIAVWIRKVFSKFQQNKKDIFLNNPLIWFADTRWGMYSRGPQLFLYFLNFFELDKKAKKCSDCGKIEMFHFNSQVYTLPHCDKGTVSTYSWGHKLNFVCPKCPLCRFVLPPEDKYYALLAEHLTLKHPDQLKDLPELCGLTKMAIDKVYDQACNTDVLVKAQMDIDSKMQMHDSNILPGVEKPQTNPKVGHPVERYSSLSIFELSPLPEVAESQDYQIIYSADEKNTVTYAFSETSLEIPENHNILTKILQNGVLYSHYPASMESPYNVLHAKIYKIRYDYRKRAVAVDFEDLGDQLQAQFKSQFLDIQKHAFNFLYQYLLEGVHRIATDQQKLPDAIDFTDIYENTDHKSRCFNIIKVVDKGTESFYDTTGKSKLPGNGLFSCPTNKHPLGVTFEQQEAERIMSAILTYISLTVEGINSDYLKTFWINNDVGKNSVIYKAVKLSKQPWKLKHPHIKWILKNNQTLKDLKGNWQLFEQFFELELDGHGIGVEKNLHYNSEYLHQEHNREQLVTFDVYTEWMKLYKTPILGVQIHFEEGQKKLYAEKHLNIVSRLNNDLENSDEVMVKTVQEFLIKQFVFKIEDKPELVDEKRKVQAGIISLILFWFTRNVMEKLKGTLKESRYFKANVIYIANVFSQQKTVSNWNQIYLKQLLQHECKDLLDEDADVVLDAIKKAFSQQNLNQKPEYSVLASIMMLNIGSNDDYDSLANHSEHFWHLLDQDEVDQKDGGQKGDNPNSINLNSSQNQNPADNNQQIEEKKASEQDQSSTWILTQSYQKNPSGFGSLNSPVLTKDNNLILKSVQHGYTEFNEQQPFTKLYHQLLHSKVFLDGYHSIPYTGVGVTQFWINQSRNLIVNILCDLGGWFISLENLVKQEAISKQLTNSHIMEFQPTAQDAQILWSIKGAPPENFMGWMCSPETGNFPYMSELLKNIFKLAVGRPGFGPEQNQIQYRLSKANSEKYVKQNKFISGLQINDAINTKSGYQLIRSDEIRWLNNVIVIGQVSRDHDCGVANIEFVKNAFINSEGINGKSNLKILEILKYAGLIHQLQQQFANNPDLLQLWQKEVEVNDMNVHYFDLYEAVNKNQVSGKIQQDVEMDKQEVKKWTSKVLTNFMQTPNQWLKMEKWDTKSQELVQLFKGLQQEIIEVPASRVQKVDAQLKISDSKLWYGGNNGYFAGKTIDDLGPQSSSLLDLESDDAKKFNEFWQERVDYNNSTGDPQLSDLLFKAVNDGISTTGEPLLHQKYFKYEHNSKMGSVDVQWVQGATFEDGDEIGTAFEELLAGAGWKSAFEEQRGQILQEFEDYKAKEQSDNNKQKQGEEDGDHTMTEDV